MLSAALPRVRRLGFLSPFEYGEQNVGGLEGQSKEWQTEQHWSCALTRRGVLFVVDYGQELLAVGFDRAQNERREYKGEQCGAVDVRVGDREYEG